MWTLPRNQWVTLQSFLWLPLLGLCALVPFLGIWERVGPGMYLAMLAIAALSLAHLVWILRAGANVADRITIARFTFLIAASAILLVAGRANLWVWWLLVLAVTLDLVDGWAARRHGATEAGAVLDMESDQFATLFLALGAHALLTAQAGGRSLTVQLGATCFLVLPAFKYAFALGLRGAPRVNEPKPNELDNTRGRRICATVLIGLLLANLPLFQDSSTFVYVRVCLALALMVLLGYSFAGDRRHVKQPLDGSTPG